MKIILRNVKKEFDGQLVYEDLNCCFSNDQINCIMGKSGIGKTTLLRLIMGALRVDAGVIEGVEGKKIRVLFQEDRLLEKNTVLDNLLLVLDGNKKENLQRIQEACEQVGLSECLKQRVQELSGGMKRRVALVRALLCDFDILLLDEPFKGIDACTREKTVDYLLRVIEYRKEHEKEAPLVIMVTHSKQEVRQVKGKILYL